MVFHRTAVPVDSVEYRFFIDSVGTSEMWNYVAEPSLFSDLVGLLCSCTGFTCNSSMLTCLFAMCEHSHQMSLGYRCKSHALNGF